MAFDFLGTLSLQQVNELRSFINGEISGIQSQINNLMAELDGVRQTKANFVDAAQQLGDTNILDRIFDRELPLVVKSKRQEDKASGLVVDEIKKPFISNIKYKRERNEYKIKKLMDLEEQIKEQMDRKAIARTKTAEMLNKLDSMFNEDRTYLFKTTDDLKNYLTGVV